MFNIELFTFTKLRNKWRISLLSIETPVTKESALLEIEYNEIYYYVNVFFVFRNH